MGNGQNRRRRGGSHGRQGPHRGASANNDRRTTQLVPPTPAGATPNAAPKPPDASEAEDARAADDDQREAGEPLAGTAGEELGEAAGEELGEAAGESAAPPAPEPLTPTAPQVSEEPAAPEPEPEQLAPRGRFERFYAPGQQPRGASNGRPIAPERNGKSHGSHAAESGEGSDASKGHTRHAPPAPEPSRASLPQPPHDGDEEDEAPIATGPREDVRGAVGGLIDSLHDLFVRDRALASQGGVSRCGICYLHYPLGELVYHEGEGFYVCQTCERALAGARVNMVRRQQRL